MPEMPLVSIITPSFNQASFLEETILSVLGQDYPNIEYIIIDGGSTDGSLEIIRRYEDRLADWVSEPDRGQTDAINKGFARARGEILAWLNSDDTYLPNAVSEAVAYLQVHPEVGMVYGDANLIDEKGQVLGPFPARQTDYGRLMRGSVHIPQQSSFFRAALWRQVGPLDPSFFFAMDYDLWVRLAKVTSLQHLPRLWANFRLQSQGKTRLSDDRCYPEMLRVHRREGGGAFSWLRLKAFARKVLYASLPLRLRLWLRNLFILLVVSGLVSGMPGAVGPAAASHQNAVPPCETPGWFPDLFGLKDHTVFWHEGFFYLMSIYVSNDAIGDSVFAYGRSPDLCSWENLSPVLSARLDGTWDRMAIWAPFVFEEEGIYYAYYTGVTNSFTQSILLATSTNPADPETWSFQGTVFQPDHPGMIWEDGLWSDCRDPMVLKVDHVYYLFYTGSDQGGGIVGVATATSPSGPWRDAGAIIPPLAAGHPESAFMTRFIDRYYLIYSDTAQGAVYRIGAGPTGPWGDPYPFRPGWVHEIWQTPGGSQMVSFLTDYQVTISPLTWDTFFYPARPVIGAEVFHVMLPSVIK